MGEVLRLVVAVAVVALLARAVGPAWQQRALALRVWRGLRPRHLAGSLALLVVVLGVALALLAFVPPTRFGLGTLVGFTGNAVFAPVQEVSVRSGGSGLTGTPGAATPAAVTGLILAFLALLVALFPWLAYVEERVFRAGLEEVSLGPEVLRALRFGLVHLIMLIPLAAALAVGVAGFVYGRVYRRAYATAAARRDLVPGPFGVPIIAAPPRAYLRAEAVLASTRLHVAFNTLVVVLVAASLLST